MPDIEETVSTTEESANPESGAAFSFSDISDLEFWFGSGAGAWRTVLTVHDDGSFEGEYLDSDMGDAGEAYPNGVLYFSEFTGQFTAPQKVNDYTYSVKLRSIELKEEPDTEEIKDGLKYIYSEPYGLDGAEEILFYLPGAPIEELPKGYREWMTGYGTPVDTELPFYGLYNVNTEEGFSSYENVPLSSIGDELAAIELEAAALGNKLRSEAMTQLDLNTTASELYQLWDGELNALWGQLKETLDAAAMEELTAAEREWIEDKEREIEKAGAEYEGGTMQPMVKNLKGAELTKARVYELAEYLR